MSFKVRLHPDVVKFLVDLNPEMKEKLKSGIKRTKKREDLYRLRVEIIGLSMQWKKILYIFLK